MPNSNKRIYWVVAAFLLFTIQSCEEKPDPSLTVFTPSIVVDGSIESNGLSRVFLTYSIPYYVQVDSADFFDLMVRHASVFLSDGEREEGLTLRRDWNLFPPYYYQGTQIRGEPGKEYKLRVVYGNTTLLSTTTIPNIPTIDSIWFQPLSDDDSKGTIQVRIPNPDPTTPTYYRFYTRIFGRQDKFYPTLLPNFTSSYYTDDYFIISLRKGPESYMDLDDSGFQFSVGDSVMIKMCTMDETQFEFWSAYQVEAAGGTNPFSASPRTLPSNVEGGMGTWAGYGVRVYSIVIEKGANAPSPI